MPGRSRQKPLVNAKTSSFGNSESPDYRPGQNSTVITGPASKIGGGTTIRQLSKLDAKEQDDVDDVTEDEEDPNEFDEQVQFVALDSGTRDDEEEQERRKLKEEFLKL